MKTLLIPVDFTPTSQNAVEFAAEWCKKYEYERIILLKTFYDSMFENIIVAGEYSSVNKDYLNTLREDAMAELQQLCKNLAIKTGPGIKVTTAVSEISLLRSIIEIIDNEKPELIVLGSNDFNHSGTSLIAGNVISIAKASPVRVLVVPAGCTYQPVDQALLPYNFNMLKDLDKLNSLRSSPTWNDLKLLVLNIDTNQQVMNITSKSLETEKKFQNLLKNFRHEIYFTSEKNPITSITQFTSDHNVQLIIALPGKHSFLYRLTHESISEAIYRNAHQPVLILK